MHSLVAPDARQRQDTAPGLAGSESSFPEQVRQHSIWSVNYACLVAAGLAVWVLVAYYAWFIGPFVRVSADVLTWSETWFVGEIIMLRNGTTLYPPPEHNNSMIYTPAAPVVTYAVAWLLGYPTSIVAWRVIQLGFVVLATLLTTLSCRLLYRVAFPTERMPFPFTWMAVWFGLLLLAAVSPETNRYVHCLHTDALALLVSAFSFLSVVLYLRTPRWGYLVLMAACPALGFLTKQFLVSWIAVIAFFLVVQRAKDYKRVMVFLGCAAVFLGGVLWTCDLLWGESFRFWAFRVMGGVRKQIAWSPGSFSFSIARMIDHVNRSWSELAIGIVGGCLLLRGETVWRLGPLWLAWLALIASEAFSSGAGWGVMYHFGPGVLIGTVWLLLALTRFWHQVAAKDTFPWSNLAVRGMAGAAGVLTVCLALRAVPTSDPHSPRFEKRHPTADLQRYIADIEREFEGHPRERVLLDVGNWVYLSDTIVMRDRAISTGDQPVAGIYENLDVMRQRLREGAYDKVLVRDLHSPWFLYDYSLWPRPSGIRETLLQHYVEVRTIPAADEGKLKFTPAVIHTGPVSVLVRKSTMR